jgi:hypothetical protein
MQFSFPGQGAKTPRYTLTAALRKLRVIVLYLKKRRMHAMVSMSVSRRAMSTYAHKVAPMHWLNME